MIKFIGCTFMALLSLAGSARSQQKPVWIAPPGSTADTIGVFAYRKNVTLTAVPAHVLVHVSGDNRFILYVNGARVGEGPARGDVQHWSYETFDLAPMLHAGANTLAARVWSFGTEAPLSQMFLRPGFVLWPEDSACNALATDASWQVRREPGWTIDPADRPTNFVVSPNEYFHADTFDWQWNAPVSPAAGWTLPEVLGEQAQWRLVANPLPPMEYSDTPAGKVVRAGGTTIGLPAELGASGFPASAVTIPKNSHATLLLDRGTLTTAYPELTLSLGEGAQVTMTYAEALYDAQGEKGNRNDIAGKNMDLKFLHDVVFADGKEHRVYQPLWWRTWRYLQIDVETRDKPLRLDALKAHFTAFPLQELATFASSDPALQRMWDVGWRTLRLDAHETYMDSPFWEQLQYVGDTRLESLVTYVTSNDDRLPRQAMQAFAESFKAPGLTESRYPTRKLQTIPPFSLLWVGMLHDYWRYRPDTAADLKRWLPTERLVMQWFMKNQRADGLFRKLDEDGYKLWNFTDWATEWTRGIAPEEKDGGSIPLSLQFVYALREAADLESADGDAALAAAYRANADRIAAAVYKAAWSPERGLLADTPSGKSFSQQTNIFGVLTDAIPADRQKAALATILADELAQKPMYTGHDRFVPASYYFRFYLARAVDHAGQADEYLQLLRPWHQMLALGLSTWAEKPEPTRSDSHAWSSHPNYDFISLVAGIQPAAPGFARVRIAPHLGNLTSLDVSMPHPAGTLHASYRTADGMLDATLTLPKGVSGEFVWEGKSMPLHAGAQHFRFTLHAGAPANSNPIP